MKYQLLVLYALAIIVRHIQSVDRIGLPIKDWLAKYEQWKTNTNK